MSTHTVNCSVRALQNIEKFPDRCALWSAEDGAVSFRKLGELAAAYQQQMMELELKAGDVVLVMALPGAHLYACLVALMGLGVGVVFIEPWMPSSQIEQTVAPLNVKALFADSFGMIWSLRSASLRRLKKSVLSSHSVRLRAAEHFKVIQLKSDLPAIISFTTGTTGRPKGVVRTHQYLWNLHGLLEKYGGDAELSGPDLTIFPNLVLYHLGTGRGSLLIPPHWKPSVLDRVRDLEKSLWPQSLSCGPAFLKHLLDHNAAFESLRRVHIGGALVECDLLERAVSALPRSQIRQVYGGTEVEPIAIVDARLSAERSKSKGYLHALNVGEPIDELMTRLDDDSILWVCGPNVCPEYLGNPEENGLVKSRDSHGRLWHCTGDRLFKDNDGFWYLGRGRQTLSDFIAEQKIYAKIGHTRLFIHRDANGSPLVVADDDVQSVSAVVHEILDEKVPVWAAVITRDRRHRSRIDRTSTWEKGLRMLRWWTYFKERSPLPVLMILALGPVVSGYFLAPISLECENKASVFCKNIADQPFVILAALVATVIFMITARMMDEVKDIEKDKIVNPQRPLPRGLISPSEMNTGIIALMICLLLLSIFLGAGGQPLYGWLMAVSAVYLWLMFKEFYVGKWLSDHPFFYALSHQVVVIPLYLLSVSLFAPVFSGEQLAWTYVGINLFSSLGYEYARKLQPDMHPSARTYRQIYGLRTAVFIAFIFQFIAFMLTAYSYFRWNISPFICLIQLTVCVILVIHGFRDGLHKYCEALASISLLFAAWLGLFTTFGF